MSCSESKWSSLTRTLTFHSVSGCHHTFTERRRGLCTYIYTHTYTHTRTHIYTHTRTRTHTHAHIHTHTHTNTRTHTHTHTRTQRYGNTHTHTHIRGNNTKLTNILKIEKKYVFMILVNVHEFLLACLFCPVLDCTITSLSRRRISSSSTVSSLTTDCSYSVTSFLFSS